VRTRSRSVVAILSLALVASQAAFSPATVSAVDPEPIRYTYDPNGRLSDGEPVTEVSITPIPIDRTPYPLPDYVEIPVYFTIQPGGAYIERTKSARLVYPNYSYLEPGSRHPFLAVRPRGQGLVHLRLRVGHRRWAPGRA